MDEGPPRAADRFPVRTDTLMSVTPAPLRIALTADLHWGTHKDGDAATGKLVEFLRADPPDLLILGGDVGAGDDFGRCLALFDGLPSRKALVPGNHDIWVRSDDARGDSLHVYREHLLAESARHGFHYLDTGPLILPESDLAVVGSINWYDYSWAIEALPNYADDWEERLRLMKFSRGRHNDRRFVRWDLDDRRFTDHVVSKLESHLAEALGRVGRAIVVTHHPPFEELCWPLEGPHTLDSLLWRAFAGNRATERLLERHADRIALSFCGHTHKARDNEYAGVPGHNIGGDYGWKRLLVVDWPAMTVAAHEFYE